MLAPVLVYAAALGGLVIIFGAGLSFLGVGVQPPTPEWGRMVADGRNDFLINPWPSLIPGACIFLVGLALNLTADRLRDHFDPRLR
jgi:peptide/nickel transport system permease protein